MSVEGIMKPANKKKDFRENFDKRIKKSSFVMINGRTITIDQYMEDPEKWNSLPIDPEYLKQVWDDYNNTH